VIHFVWLSKSDIHLVMLDSSFGETQGAFKIHVCIYICILLIVCNKVWGNCILYNCFVMCHVIKLMQKLVKGNNRWWPSPLKGNVESKLLKWRAHFEGSLHMGGQRWPFNLKALIYGLCQGWYDETPLYHVGMDCTKAYSKLYPVFPIVVDSHH
jgi:hypothetical protein